MKLVKHLSIIAVVLSFAVIPPCIADTLSFDKPGFVTLSEEGRLWVFRKGATEFTQYQEHGELAKHVVRPNAGPGGITLKAPDSETIMEYLTVKPGFVTSVEDGRLWVFRSDTPELEQFRVHGELAKHVVRPASGPFGMTLKAPDGDTIDEYLRR